MIDEVKQKRGRRIGQIMDAAKSVASKLPDEHKRAVLQAIENLGWHISYSEPGYSGDVIITGNWNEVQVQNPVTRYYEDVSDILKRMGDAFEKAGAEIEWDDEWSTCNDCSGLVRTEPDSFSWKPSYIVFESALICKNCMNDSPGDVLSHCESKQEVLDCPFEFDPSVHGYVRYNPDSVVIRDVSGSEAKTYKEQLKKKRCMYFIQLVHEDNDHRFIFWMDKDYSEEEDED